MATAVDVLMDATRQTKAREARREARLPNTLERIRQDNRQRQQIQIQQQLANIRQQELELKVASAPESQLIRQSRKADALMKLRDAGAINDQQFDQGISQLNANSLKRNLSSILTAPIAAGTQPTQVPAQATQVQQFLPQAPSDQGLTPSQRLQQREQAKSQAKIAEAVGTQTEKELAKERVGAEKGVKGTRRFVQQFERSFKELEAKFPDIGKTGIEGKGTRLAASIGEKFDAFPETSTLLTELKVIANQTARDVEGGRVTDEDRKIYADALANAVKNPSAENTRLVSNSLIRLADKGGDISKIVREFSGSSVDVISNVAEQVFAQFPELRPNQQISISAFRNAAAKILAGRS